MRDWSGSLVSADIWRKKAEKELVMINGGLSPELRKVLIDKAEADLCGMLSDVIDTLAWVRAQR
jgi:hypothetical protein